MAYFIIKCCIRGKTENGVVIVVGVLESAKAIAILNNGLAGVNISDEV